MGRDCRVAGGSKAPRYPTTWTDDTLKRIYEYTRGIHHQINHLYTTVLITGRIDQKQILDDRSIRKAIAKIDQR